MKDVRDEELHLLVKDSFKTESFRVKVLQEKPRSKEDKRAEEIMKATMKCVGEHFEIGLLWRSDDPEDPEFPERMIGRCGLPAVIYSDNGTNFHGANMEIKRASAKIDQDKILQEVLF